MTTAHEPRGHEPRAARKALALLEAVARTGPGASARELSRDTGIPPATAYRLLNLLVADGYLVRIADLSGFALGRRTRELAGSAPDDDGPERVHTVVTELRAQVRFGIFVATFVDDRIRLVDRDPDHELPGEQTLVAHPHASAMGKMLLAARPDLRPTTPRRLTRNTLVDPGELDTHLSTIAATGLAWEVDEARAGRSALAVAVHDGGTVVGCVTAIGRTGRLPLGDPALVTQLRSAAARMRLAPHTRRRLPARFPQ